jgi:hypothetical protein
MGTMRGLPAAKRAPVKRTPVRLAYGSCTGAQSSNS